MSGGVKRSVMQYAKEEEAKQHADAIGGFVKLMPYNRRTHYDDCRGQLRIKGIEQSSCSRALAREEGKAQA